MAKPRTAQPGEINHPWVDRFTFVHFLIGFGYGGFGLGLGVVLILAVGWELIENPLKSRLPFIFPHATADTLQNSIGDFLAVMLGWWICQLFF